jgi:hypothetical protein
MNISVTFFSAVSRRIHDVLFDGPSQTLCARAWENRQHRAWRMWVFVFGANHCREAHAHWRRKRP